MAPRFLLAAGLSLAALACAPAHAEQWTLCTALSHDGNPAYGVVSVSPVFPVSTSGDYLAQWRAYIDRKYPGMSTHVALCSNAVDAEAQATTGRGNFIARYNDAMVVAEEDWRPQGAAAPRGEPSVARTDDAGDALAEPGLAPEAPRATADEAGATDADAAAREAQARAEQRAQQDAAADAAARRQAEAKRAEEAAMQEREAKARAEREAAAAALLRAQDQRNAGLASTDTDANRCVTSPEVTANASFQGNTAASVSNGCAVPVDVRICLQTDAGWNCGVGWGLAPQQRWSFSAFKATGPVFVDARVSGSNARAFASPQ